METIPVKQTGRESEGNLILLDNVFAIPGEIGGERREGRGQITAREEEKERKGEEDRERREINEERGEREGKKEREKKREKRETNRE